MDIARVAEQIVDVDKQIEDITRRYNQELFELNAKRIALLTEKLRLIAAPRVAEIASAEAAYDDTGKLVLTGASFCETAEKPTYGKIGSTTTRTSYDPNTGKLTVDIQHSRGTFKFYLTEIEQIVKLHGGVTYIYPIRLQYVRTGTLRSEDYDEWSALPCVAVHTEDGACHLFHTGKQDTQHKQRYFGHVMTSSPKVESISMFSVDIESRKWIDKRLGLTSMRHVHRGYGQN